MESSQGRSIECGVGSDVQVVVDDRCVALGIGDDCEATIEHRYVVEVSVRAVCRADGGECETLLAFRAQELPQLSRYILR